MNEEKKSLTEDQLEMVTGGNGDSLEKNDVVWKLIHTSGQSSNPPDLEDADAGYISDDEILSRSYDI